MVEGGTVGDAVEGQAPVEAFPVGHNLVEGIGLAEFFGVAAPVFDFSGADVDGVVKESSGAQELRNMPETPEIIAEVRHFDKGFRFSLTTIT